MPQIKKIVLALLTSVITISATQTLADIISNPNAPAKSSTIKTANAEFVHKYLLGEIAGQRGKASLASQLFLDLAKKTHDPRLAKRAARAALYARQQALAIKAASLWIKLDPNSIEAMQAFSQILIASGDLDSAKPLLKKLLAKDNMRANGFLYLYDLIKKQGDNKKSLTLIKELAKPYPNAPEAHFSIAQAAWHAGQITTAFNALKKADQLRPGWEIGAQMQAKMLQKESPAQAIAFYKTFLVDHPNANDVRMSYAKMLVAEKYYGQAKPQFIKLIENAHGNPDISAVVGLLALETKDYALANKYLQQALSEGFKDPHQLYLYLGRAAEQNKNDAKAIKWYSKVGQGQHYLEGNISKASVIARTQSVDAAIAMLDTVDQLTFEEQIMIVQTQVGLLSQANRKQEAFDLIEKAVKNSQETPGLLYDYAMMAERIGNLTLMEEQLRKIIKIQPDYAAAYNALGYSYADRNINLTEAKTLIQVALKLSPDNHYMLDSLGWVEYRLGNFQQAIKVLRKAYAIQNDPEIAAHLGEVLWKQGLKAEAEKIWSNALTNFPNNNLLVTTANKFKS